MKGIGKLKPNPREDQRRLNRMHVEYIKRISNLYARLGYSPYTWVRNEDTPPWQPLKGPLNKCRVAVSASGGIYKAGQLAFHYKDDDSYRAISKDVNIKDLRITHFAYDMTDARHDPNCVFPIEPLQRMEKEGFIGKLAPFQYTFMGGIYSSRKVRENLAPAIIDKLLKDKVDALLLVPV
jgi:D-proline reductase (dithiol) PrdB